jgi:hypothetical protein
MSRVSLLFPIFIEGGRAAEVIGDFLGSNRLKSVERAPLAGFSARIVSLATWVEAVDFRGQVPYQLLFGLSCFNELELELESPCFAFMEVGSFSRASWALLGLLAAGVDGLADEVLACSSGGFVSGGWSALVGAFVRGRFLDGPIK